MERVRFGRGGAARNYPHRLKYTAAGMAVSLGSPLGLLVLRAFASGGWSWTSIAADVVANPLLYLYLTSTTLVAFGVFGFVLGQQSDRLQYLSGTDVLTGLPNRRALEAHLRRECDRARRYKTPLSVLLVDVDELKRINSVHGHSGGDRAIRSIARAITMTSRETDIGGRWGGDEFLVIAPSTPASAAVTLAERLRGQLASLAISDANVPTSSVGIATCEPARDPRCDPDTLVRSADAALRNAKQSGRNQVRVA